MFKKISIPSSVFKKESFSKAKRIIPYFYYFLFFLASLETVRRFIHTIPQILEDFSPSWIVFWINYIPTEVGFTIIITFFLMSTLAGAFFYRYRWGRVLPFLGLFLYIGWLSSIRTYHQMDHWLWVSFLLIFIPDIWNKKAGVKDSNKKFLLTVWLAQAYILLTYTMTGIGKIYGGVSQLLSGEISIFSNFLSVVLHVVVVPQNVLDRAPLTDLVIQFPVVSFVFLWLVIYIQLFSVFIAFRPELHKLWGTLIILFHTSTIFFMQATFIWVSPLLFLFFIESPFSTQESFSKNDLKRLPVVNFIFSRFNIE